MANGSEQKPKIRLELLIATLTLALGLLAYLRPPDPAHPTSLDFLSKAISLPLWLAGIAVLGIAAITAAIVRWKFIPSGAGPTIALDGKTIAEQKRQINELKSRLVASEARAKVLTPSKPNFGIGGGGASRGPSFAATTAKITKPFYFDIGVKQLSFPSAEGPSLQIDSHQNGTYGLVLYVINDTPDYVASYRVEVAEANSWNERHKTFLPNRTFNRREVHSGKNLEPIHKTNSQWLVRVLTRNDDARLAIGNDDQNLLSWPNNDPTTVEIWRLTLAVSYQPASDTRGTVKGLVPALLVRWDRETGMIHMMKYE